MKITSIRIKKNKHNKDNTLLGIASIELDNCLVITNLKLIQLDNKRFVCFPNRKQTRYVYDMNGTYTLATEYTDLVHPCTKEFRQYIETELFKIYDKEEETLDNE